MSKPSAGGKLPPESCEKVVLNTRFTDHPNLHTIMTFYVNGSRLEDKMKAQYDSAASAVHAWAYSIEKEQLQKGKTLYEIADICADLVDREIASVSATYQLTDDREQKKAFSKFDQAYRKVVGCLRNGGSLSEYTTCTACANFNKEQNEKAVAKQQHDQAVEALVSGGMTKQEAERKLASGPTAVPNTGGSGIAANDVSMTPLQETFLRYATALEQCREKNHEMVDDFVDSLNDKVENICLKLLKEALDNVTGEVQKLAS